MRQGMAWIEPNRLTKVGDGLLRKTRVQERCSKRVVSLRIARIGLDRIASMDQRLLVRSLPVGGPSGMHSLPEHDRKPRARFSVACIDFKNAAEIFTGPLVVLLRVAIEMPGTALI